MQRLLAIATHLFGLLRPALASPWLWVGMAAVAALLASLAALLNAKTAYVTARVQCRPYLQVSEWADEAPLPDALATQPFRLRLRLVNAGQVGAFLGDSRCRLLLDGKLAGEGRPPVTAALLFAKSELMWITDLHAAQYPIAAVLAGKVRLGVELELRYSALGGKPDQLLQTTIHAEFRPGYGWVTLEASAT